MWLSSEWIIGILVIVFSSLLGAVYAMTVNNSNRLTKHDILFATFSGMNKKIDDLCISLEKREEKEDKQFQEITHRLEKLTVNVALIKKSSNGDE